MLAFSSESDRRQQLLEILRHDRLAARLAGAAAGAGRTRDQAGTEPVHFRTRHRPACGPGCHGRRCRSWIAARRALPPQPGSSAGDAAEGRASPAWRRRTAPSTSTSTSASSRPIRSSCAADCSTRPAWRSRPVSTSTPSVAIASCACPLPAPRPRWRTAAGRLCEWLRPARPSQAGPPERLGRGRPLAPPRSKPSADPAAPPALPLRPIFGVVVQRTPPRPRSRASCSPFTASAARASAAIVDRRLAPPDRDRLRSAQVQILAPARVPLRPRPRRASAFAPRGALGLRGARAPLGLRRCRRLLDRSRPPPSAGSGSADRSEAARLRASTGMTMAAASANASISDVAATRSAGTSIDDGCVGIVCQATVRLPRPRRPRRTRPARAAASLGRGAGLARATPPAAPLASTAPAALLAFLARGGPRRRSPSRWPLLRAAGADLLRRLILDRLLDHCRLGMLDARAPRPARARGPGRASR